MTAVRLRYNDGGVRMMEGKLMTLIAKDGFSLLGGGWSYINGMVVR